MFGSAPVWAPRTRRPPGRSAEGSPPMLNDRELSAAIGSTAFAPDGDRIGTVEHFFVDDRTGAPTWVAVTTGLFGTRHSIVPAHDASLADGVPRSEEHTSELQSPVHLVCRLLLEKKKKNKK